MKRIITFKQQRFSKIIGNCGRRALSFSSFSCHAESYGILPWLQDRCGRCKRNSSSSSSSSQRSPFRSCSGVLKFMVEGSLMLTSSLHLLNMLRMTSTNGEKHWAQLCQPLCIHSCHRAHVLFRREDYFMVHDEFGTSRSRVKMMDADLLGDHSRG